MTGRQTGWLWCAAVLCMAALVWVTAVSGQETPADSGRKQPVKQQADNSGEQPEPEDSQTPSETPPPGQTTDQPGGEQAAGAASTADQVYGFWVLLPPLVAIILAVITRQVIPSLIVGILTGAFMITPHLSGPGSYGDSSVAWRAFRVAVETYLIGQPTRDAEIDAASGLDTNKTYVVGVYDDEGKPREATGALKDVRHLNVVLFTLLIGGMVGVLAANGGTRAMVQSVSHWASNSKRGQIMGWLAGLVVFFDDYANSMIVGPTMRPIYDKLRISREKLAYIVDSTAAPVASLALVGTWIGAEIGFIQAGLDQVGSSTPSFLAGVSAYQVFLYSIPYRFYAIFALVLVLLIGYLGRDFGPMKRSERRAVLEGAVAPGGMESESPASGKWWYAGYPIILLMALTLTILFWTGWAGVDESKFGAMGLGEQLGEILHNADAYGSILYGAIGSLALAFVLSLFAKALTIHKTVEAVMEGMSRMFPAVVILVLAWTLSQIMQDLQLAKVAERYLGPDGIGLHASFLPLAIFVASAIVSFATGTSWGTMGILCPVAVTVSIGLVGELPPEEASQLFYASVGSVLAGAVFGDHCSPISDTTVLSALASGCSLESHVWTQIPYALTAAVVAMACGDVLCSHYHQPWWIGLLVGTGALVTILFVVGRRPSAAVRPRAGS